MNKHLQRILIIFAVLGILFGTFGLYVADAYPAGQEAASIAETAEEGICWLELTADSDVGFIFYPGAKVEYTAYLPLLQQLQESGVNCYLAEMPCNLAFFGMNRAAYIMAAHPEIEMWYLGGHSLGGAFASRYASQHSDAMAGVILLGAYLYGDYPVEQSLTIYGSEDQVLRREKITDSKNVHVISGGNHAQFGNYGPQKGDGTATISPKTQQTETAQLILEFMKEEST